MRWFSKNYVDTPIHKFTSEVPLQYPMWTFVSTESARYLILEKTKLKFISNRAFWSWSKPCIQTNDAAISSYVLGGEIGFCPGTLVVSQVDKSEYFISGKNPLKAERRLITNPDFYHVLGFDISKAFVISLSELDFHPRGKDIV